MDELERIDKAKIINGLKNERDKFRREFQLELSRYFNKNHKERQKIRRYQNLRNIISMYENKIREILLPFLNIVSELNLGWVIK
jgi:hypothetical protein